MYSGCHLEPLSTSVAEGNIELECQEVPYV